MSVQITRILVYEYEEYEVFFYECTKYSNFRLRVRGVRGIFLGDRLFHPQKLSLLPPEIGFCTRYDIL